MLFYSEKSTRPPLVLKIFGSFTEIILNRLKSESSFFQINRFFTANRVPYLPLDANTDISTPIEILFVSTCKDFAILPDAIEHAFVATSKYPNTRITVITPDKYVNILKDLLQEYEVIIHGESIYFDAQTLEKLEKTFQNRFGWVLQQLLKLKFTFSSNSSGVLIIDSDTLLLDQRQWLLSNGAQLLTPTWEYHRPYYKYLKSIGICDLTPEFTFVSHHMLMQPKILKDLFAYVGWTEVQDLAEIVCSEQNLGEQSPFSLDYELYAQYLYKFHPDKVLLGKWSNKAVALPTSKIDRKVKIEEEIKASKNRFASLSFHSYL